MQAATGALPAGAVRPGASNLADRAGTRHHATFHFEPRAARARGQPRAARRAGAALVRRCGRARRGASAPFDAPLRARQLEADPDRTRRPARRCARRMARLPRAARPAPPVARLPLRRAIARRELRRADAAPRALPARSGARGPASLGRQGTAAVLRGYLRRRRTRALDAHLAARHRVAARQRHRADAAAVQRPHLRRRAVVPRRQRQPVAAD